MSKIVSWVNPTTYTDGSALNGQQDIAGYGIKIDGQSEVSVPTGYATSFDIQTLASYAALKRGAHTVAVSVVAKDGAESDFSGSATFQIVVKPSTVTSVSVV